MSFEVDGTTTYGTVHVPTHRPGQRLPAALLLPGSGSVDRDGNVPPVFVPETLKLIAGVVADDGVMTLRFDKYFSGQTGGGAFAKDPSRIELNDFLRQAHSAYDLLRSQPEADPRSMLIVGHSEGGLTAMLVGEVASPRPAGLALLAPQSGRLLDLIRMQLGEWLDSAVEVGKLTQQVAQENKDGISHSIDQFRAGRPMVLTGLVPYVSSILKVLQANARFARTDDAVDPVQVALRVRASTRVLVTCGSNDLNVPCFTVAPVATALGAAGTTGPGFRTLANVDHLLHPSGVAVNDPVLADDVVQALHDFTHSCRPRRTP